ncbi:uncharacterized protein LOC121374603 isoform X2 [Gigantopelta aegis]|nr:uncharacterized protein LOC121374603 isoform X2 [Gigantopelta aegis]
MIMKWTSAIVTLIVAFVVSVNSVHGEATASVECLQKVVKGERMELTCSIAGTIQSGILWIRPDGSKVVVCNANSTECRSVDPAKYEGHYAGVVDSLSRHTLIIKSFNPDTDAGNWGCKDGPSGKQTACKKSDKLLVISSEAAGGKYGERAHVTLAYVLIFWNVAKLAANLQITSSMFFN